MSSAVPVGTDNAEKDVTVPMHGCTMSWPLGHGICAATASTSTVGVSAEWWTTTLFGCPGAGIPSWAAAVGTGRVVCISTTPSAISTVRSSESADEADDRRRAPSDTSPPYQDIPPTGITTARIQILTAVATT